MKWGNVAAALVCPVVIVSQLGPAGVAMLLLFGLIWKASMDVIEDNFNKLSNAPRTDSFSGADGCDNSGGQNVTH